MHYFDDTLVLGILYTKIWCSLLRLLVVGYAGVRNDRYRHDVQRFTTQNIALNAYDYRLSHHKLQLHHHQKH